MIDWSKAPKNAHWWAIDADGKAHWYGVPDVKPFTTFWFNSDPIPAPAFGFDLEKDDWKKSLTERP